MALLTLGLLAAAANAATPVILMSENFEGFTLRAFQSPGVSGGDGTDWTPELPEGWALDLAVTPIGDPIEFQGWRILDVDSWIATQGDRRSRWTRVGIGRHDSVLVADPDAYDDGTNVDPNYFTAFISTRPIDLVYVVSNSVTIEFDSFWFNERPQQGRLEVTFDGGRTFQSILTYDSNQMPEGTLIDERPRITLNNPASGTMFFRFSMFNAGNNWWWAIDDVVITGTPAERPASITVQNKSDSGAGSLRQAIADARDGDSIAFAPTVTGTIVLTSGELVIGKSLSIVGPCAKELALSGNDSSRVFRIANGIANLSGLTITHARGVVPEFGGGILNRGRLNLTNCTLRSNSATTTDSSGNGGGAILNEPSGVVTLHGCTIAENFSQFGGALHNQGTLIASDTTISGNFSSIAATIYSSGTLILRSCTVASNHAAIRGGLQNDAAYASLANCLIAANHASNDMNPDVAGTFVSLGYNLIGTRDGSEGLTHGINHDQVGTIAAPINPMLAPLADNGGCTATHRLLSGSPAIDQGRSFRLWTDQRGAPRPFLFSPVADPGVREGSDVGAFELGRPLLSIALATTNAVLSWPAYYGDFVLQSDASLGWLAVSGVPVVVGDRFHFTNGAVGPAKFFRLSGP